MPTPYDTENLLVERFLEHLLGERGPLGPVQVSREFDYQRGRADVVAVTLSGAVVAFEAKLSRWRTALNQAYRNRCFADVSFVVFPKATAVRAASYAAEFDRRGVGICYVCANEGLVVMTEGDRSEPLQHWLRDIARAKVAQTSQPHDVPA